MIYDYTIYPIECIYKVIYLCFYSLADSYGLALIFLSIFTSCITHPLMKWASNISKDEKEVQKYLTPQLEKIKARLSGAEQHHAIQRLYKRYGYHPVMAVRTAIGVMLQLPFLMAAYYMLSNLEAIKGVAWLFVKDLGQPDMLIAGFNIMPFVMTAVNLLSAYTTVGFTKKDKLQAFVIAGMFLVLLYGAPSALLIYWTFNNLWSLLGNLFDFNNIYVLASKTFRINKSDDWLLCLTVIITISITIGILLPLDIYLNNANEFWFGLLDVFPLFLFGAAFILMILLINGILFFRLNLLDKYTIFLFGLLVALYLQSYIINLNYGVLDGREINWDKYSSIGFVNILVWITCITFILYIFRKLKNVKVKRIISISSVLVIVIQVFSLVYLAESRNVLNNKNKNDIVVTTNNMWKFSRQDNLIVLILDAFDSSYLSTLLKTKNKKRYEDILVNFTYYPDTMGAYASTKGALPHILTGIKYFNDRPYDEYVRIAHENSNLYKELLQNNYEVNVYTNKIYMSPNVNLYANVKNDNYIINDKVNLCKDYYKLVLFKSLPHFLKSRFIVQTDEFDKYRALYKEEPFSMSVQKFYRDLKTCNFDIIENKNVFKVYHLAGAHGPFTFGRDLKTKPGKKYKAINEADGCLTLLNMFFQKLKLNGLYDNSNIIVMADHGGGGIGLMHNPLFLIKHKNEKHSFKVSDVPLSYNILDDVYVKLINSERISKDYLLQNSDNQVRSFNFYTWGGMWNNEFLPGMKEYIAVGKAYNAKSLRFTGNIFERKWSEKNLYKLGTNVDFSTRESARYCGRGFGFPNKTGRSTIDSEAVIMCLINEKINNDLSIKINHRTYAGKQRVIVVVNEKEINRYVAEGSEEKILSIPIELLDNGKLELKFVLPDAVSPNTIGKGNDSRKQALVIRGFVIE